MSSVISVRELTKMYGQHNKGAEPVLAVDHINFDVQAGEVFGFLGPNGAGKTTTIRICTGISKPTSGHVEIAGLDISQNPLRVKERIGVVSDVFNPYSELSAWDNLQFIARLHNVPKKKRTTRIAELLQLFGLYDRRHDRVATFSTGMRKHLSIAAALVHEPQILFLDEPTTGLDAQSARRIRQMVRELSQGGTTILLTTHYIEEADQLCQRIAIINKGRIVTVRTPDELKGMVHQGGIIEASVDGAAEPIALKLEACDPIREVHVSGNSLKLHADDPCQALAALFETTRACGRRLTSVNTVRPTLEDAFVEITGLQAEIMTNEKEAHK